MTEHSFTILPLIMPNGHCDPIDIKEIKRVAELGLDETDVLDRPLAWLVMLGILPDDRSEWHIKLISITETYWNFVKDFGMDDWHTLHVPTLVQREFFQVANQSQMAVIHGDIVRTGRLIFFFPGERIPGVVPEQGEETEMIFEFEAHARRLERILYVFAQLNPGQGYMQGYNELVSPFYYVLYKARQFFSNDIRIIEALAFSCIQVLLTESELHELYTTTDQSSIIMHRLNEFDNLLKQNLPKAYQTISKHGLHPLLYCYRWFNLMFSQEHDMPEILVIWDALLAHFDNLVEYIFYVGLGHIKMVEKGLDPNSYGDTLSALQNLTNLDVKEILKFAKERWDIAHKKHLFARLRGK